MTKDNFGTWLEIDLDILRSNFTRIRELSQTKVMPIVKANAYGHGLDRIATELESAGAEWLGVARIEEALSLREIGVNTKLLVLGYTPPTRVSHAINHDISLTVYDFRVVNEYVKHANGMNKSVNLHAKIDTGMGRLGVLPENGFDFIKLIDTKNHLRLEGLFTHFACADEPNKTATQNQIRQFDKVLNQLEEANIECPLIHASNSAGFINFDQARFDMVRAGIALYGHAPAHGTPLPDGIYPIVSWKTRLISIKQLPAGHGISYGHQYHTQNNEKIGVVAVGYGDGLRRRSGNHVLIRGKKVPIVGNVCMDQCMVQLDGIDDARIGDEVVIIGEQNNAMISATDIADDWGTINYEVLCGLAARMPRYYFNGK